MLTLARIAFVWPLAFAFISGLRTPTQYWAFIWLSILAALVTIAALLIPQEKTHA